MDAKDLRTETVLGERSSDGTSKYSHMGTSLPCSVSKNYPEISSNPLAKVDTPTSRPCAVIGPDRVLPPLTNTEKSLVKNHYDPWPPTEGMFRHPPEYPHKNYQSPVRNISPRQTFQENMQRIMVAPSYSSMKLNEETNFVDRNASLPKNKLSVSAEPKYCEVPYSINHLSENQKNPEICVSNVNNVRNCPPIWHPTGVNMRSTRPYGAPELYPFPDYASCAGPRPMAMTRPPHRTMNDESNHLYNEGYYHHGNVRFKPYPNVKERYPQARYEYVGNYPNPFHPPPPFPAHKYDLHKTLPSHPAYPQVPIKYLENRVNDTVIDGYQRPNQQINYSAPYQNQMLHSPYGPVLPNNLQTKLYPYPQDKAVSTNKATYESSKMYLDYENTRTKPYPDNFYVNDISKGHMKSQVMIPNYPTINLPPHPYYRKEYHSGKGYEYIPHYRNIDPTINASHLTRIAPQFSPNGIAISPADSNTSNDTAHTHGNSLEDCGYVSQSSTASVRSIDSGMHRMIPSDAHRRYSYSYPSMVRASPFTNKMQPNANHPISPKDKKGIDVRQFLQMWSEGDDENVGNSKEALNNFNQEFNKSLSQYEGKTQDQLYVLGLVNVPSEELGKYEHIQKVSKLPDNIKGYNNIELLKHFEEAIESSNLNNVSKTTAPRITQSHRNSISAGIAIPPRPLSPLDVEAKISQSVIHKEVGCNFEIRPCSPEMLNVEVATPVQNIIQERVIEKVSNPYQSPSTMNLSDNARNCNIPQQDHVIMVNENVKIPSCKLINTQCLNSDVANVARPDYSLQDLESNSGVCLASLPRLDNDIELNFPEVNQQFINDNKDTVITSNDLQRTTGVNNVNYNNDSTSVSDNTFKIPPKESEKEFSKLSKYRKNKKFESESKEQPLITNSQFLRTDSVIIKNPENSKYHEDSTNNSSECTHSEKEKDDILSITHNTQYNNIDKSSKTFKEQDIDIAIDFSLQKSKPIFESELKEGDHLNSCFVDNMVDKYEESKELADADIQGHTIANPLPENNDSILTDAHNNNVTFAGLDCIERSESETIIDMAQESIANTSKATTQLNADENILCLSSPNKSNTKCNNSFSEDIGTIDVNNIPNDNTNHSDIHNSSNTYSSIIDETICEKNTNQETIMTQESVVKKSKDIIENENEGSITCKLTLDTLYKNNNENTMAEYEINVGVNTISSKFPKKFKRSDETALTNKRNCSPKSSVVIEESMSELITDSGMTQKPVGNVSNETIQNKEESVTRKPSLGSLNKSNDQNIIVENEMNEVANPTLLALSKTLLRSNINNITDFHNSSGKSSIVIDESMSEKITDSCMTLEFINNTPKETTVNESEESIASEPSQDNLSKNNNNNDKILETTITVGENSNTLSLFKQSNQNNVTIPYDSLAENSPIFIEENTSEKVANKDNIDQISVEKNPKDIILNDTSFEENECGCNAREALSKIKENSIKLDSKTHFEVHKNGATNSTLKLSSSNFDVDDNFEQDEKKCNNNSFTNPENQNESNDSAKQAKKPSQVTGETCHVNSLEDAAHESANLNLIDKSLEIRRVSSGFSFKLVSPWIQKLILQIDDSIIKTKLIKVPLTDMSGAHQDHFETCFKSSITTKTLKASNQSSNLSSAPDNNESSNVLDITYPDINSISSDDVSTVVNEKEKNTNENFLCGRQNEEFPINLKEPNYGTQDGEEGNTCVHFVGEKKLMPSPNILSDLPNIIKEDLKKTISAEPREAMQLPNILVNNKVCERQSGDKNKKEFNFSKPFEKTRSANITEPLFSEDSENLLASHHGIIKSRDIKDSGVCGDIPNSNEQGFVSSKALTKDPSNENTEGFGCKNKDEIKSRQEVHIPVTNNVEIIDKDILRSNENLQQELKNESLKNTTTLSDDGSLKSNSKKANESSKSIQIQVSKAILEDSVNLECESPIELGHVTESMPLVYSQETENSEYPITETRNDDANHETKVEKKMEIYQTIQNVDKPKRYLNDTEDLDFKPRVETEVLTDHQVKVLVSNEERKSNELIEFNVTPELKNNLSSDKELIMSPNISTEKNINNHCYNWRSADNGVSEINNIENNNNPLPKTITGENVANIQDTEQDTSVFTDDESTSIVLEDISDIHHSTNKSKTEYITNFETRRYTLKRSLSESALDIINIDSSEFNNEPFSKKRRKNNQYLKISDSDFVTPSVCDFQSNRRNSISSVYNEENLSFCIVIDDDCIITQENDEDEDKICFAEITEQVFPEALKTGIVESTETLLCTETETCMISEPFVLEISDENAFQKSWVDDIGCVETVVSDDVAEDVTISAPSSPHQNALENDEPDVFIGSYGHTDKVKHIYGGLMCNDDAEFLETLYRTPQMNVNKTLSNRDPHITDDNEEFNPLININTSLSNRDSHITDFNEIPNEYDSAIKENKMNEVANPTLLALSKTLIRSNIDNLTDFHNSSGKSSIVIDESMSEKITNSYMTQEFINNTPKETTVNETEESVASEPDFKAHSEHSTNSELKVKCSSSYNIPVDLCNHEDGALDKPQMLEDACKHLLSTGVDENTTDVVKTQDGTVNSCESSVDNVFLHDQGSDSLNSDTQSSPEVSSTTSEEKCSSILLKITNYKGMRTSQLNEINVESSSSHCCKFTENINYTSCSDPSKPRALITKGAQKYIPPLRETSDDLKVKLPLPQQRLLKLKQLKLKNSKAIPKPSQRSSTKINDTSKKPKPRFEDVLKSIDEIHIKMHKEKSKKPKKPVPKVVIKKSENGSHYASMPNKTYYNPDLTGRKWQPWVFIEKDSFIDKMAIKKKTKAILNHRKNTFVLADKFQKYKSDATSAKFIISQPKLDDSSMGHLKYTIRLKHTH